MFVKFYYKAVEVGTDEDGVPLFVDEVWVTINRDMTHTMDRKATEEHFEKFKELYDAFLRETADYENLEGYPLEQWAALRPSEVMNFKARGFRTVQDVAKANMSKMPPEYKVLVKRARQFIELAGAGKGLTEKAAALEAENEQLREDLADRQKTIAALQKSLEAA